MPTDYATLMDAAHARLGRERALDPNMASAMTYFGPYWLHRDACPYTFDEVGGEEALRAAVLTRYPGFDTDGVDRTAIPDALYEPLTMAILVEFVLIHDDILPDPESRDAVYRAIAREVDALLTETPDAPELPGSIHAMDADVMVTCAGLASGLARSRERIAAEEAA